MDAQAQPDKKMVIAYWVVTILLAIPFALGGVADLIGPADVVELFEGLGYPLYLPPFLGVAKLAAVVTILAPKFHRLKEWAYAGMTIDLLGAAYSHAAIGDDVRNILLPLGFWALVLGSYFLRPPSRKLPDAPATAASGGA